MPLRENELARRTVTGLDLRAEPLRVRWEFPDLVTSDGHELRCVFTGSVRALPDRTERRMLEELLLDGRAALFAEDVARHFFPALRGAATLVAPAHDARQWLESDAPRLELIAAIKAAAGKVAFACGLEFLPPFQAEFQSPTFERQRARAMQQALIEKEAAGQVEHLSRTAELLKQFQSLRAAAPDLPAGRLMERINSNDRAALMQALMMAGAKHGASALWAVAGPYLVKVDASQPIDGASPPRAELFPMPPTLGPLRSVSADEVDGRRVLLVGAQRGFLLVDMENLAEGRAYIDPGFESPLGFNRVVYWASRQQFCATHSEGGLVCWDADVPAGPAKALRPPDLGIVASPMAQAAPPTMVSMSIRVGGGTPGPRNLRRFNRDRLLFSIGGKILAWDGKSIRTIAEPSLSEVVALVPDGPTVWTVHEEGVLAGVDIGTGNVLSSERRFARIRAAGVLPWMGEPRLLIAGDDGPVQCVGFNDPLVTQYHSAHRGLRVVAGSAGLVAGVSPDRQRVVLWNSWDGKHPACELFIGALARHRIADIAIA